MERRGAPSTATTCIVRALCLGLALGLAMSAALAAEDDGLPLGDLVARPSLTAEAVYDSNVYRQQQDPEADLGLQVLPKLQFVYPGENFRWELGAYYRFFTYFNVGGRNHSVLRDVANFGISTTIDANRKGGVGFWFNPSFFNRRGLRGGDSDASQGSDLGYDLGVSTPLELRLRPTAAFTVNVDAHWQYIRAYFVSTAFDPNPAILGQPHDVGGGASLDWKFFPRSHFLFDGDVGHVFQGPYDAGTALHDAPVENTYFRLGLGLKGDVTRKLSMMGMVGYGGVYLGEELREKNLTGIEGLLGQAEIALRPVLTQRFAVGFRRDFQFKYYAYHITDTQAYFKYKGLIAGRLGILGDFSYTYRDLEGADGGSDGIPRQENQWTAGLSAEIMVARWFHVLAGYRFSGINPSTNNVGEYYDHRFNLGVTLGFR